MTDLTACVICGAVLEEQGWTAWDLPEEIHWRGAFSDADEPPTAAGRCRACPVCTRWIPRHRAGAMPAVLQQGIHATVTALPLHPSTRRQLHAELVGRARHLASQLRPVVPG
jgi:hypothetical protein